MLAKHLPIKKLREARPPLRVHLESYRLLNKFKQHLIALFIGQLRPEYTIRKGPATHVSPSDPNTPTTKMSFADIGKIPKDFLSKDFVQSKDVNKVVVTGPKSEKLNVKFTGQKVAAKGAAAPSVLATIEPTFAVDSQITVKGTVKSTQELSGEVEVNGKLLPGLKTIVKVESAKGYKVTLTDEYKKDDLSTKIDVEADLEKEPVFTGKVEGSYAYKQFLAGGRAVFKVGTGLTEWGVAGQFKETDYNVSVFADSKDKFECGARFFYNLPKVAVAAEVINSPGQDLKYSFGWSRTLADRSGSVKAKVDLPTGRFNWAYKTELGRATAVNSQLTVATSFDTYTGFGANPQFGFNLDVQL